METLRRRSFIAAATGAAFTPLLTWAATEVPALLDHVLLGCNDLDRGIDFVEQHTGVRATFGGAHPGDLEKFSVRLREAGISFDGPRPGSRQRPDGKLLQWKTLNLKDDKDGLLPFFIEWGANSLHPSADAPKGCKITNFGAVTPSTAELTKIVTQLQLDLPVS